MLLADKGSMDDIVEAVTKIRKSANKIVSKYRAGEIRI